MSRAIDIYGDFYRMFRESPGMCRMSFSLPSKTNVDLFPMCVTIKAENGPFVLELEMALPPLSVERNREPFSAWRLGDFPLIPVT